MAALLAAPMALAQTPANARPRWCAQYGGSLGGATNCGFFTIEQCRATL